MITIHCQPCRLDPDGAWSATSKHSRTRSMGTGRVRSNRLRTERVVVSSSSGVRGSVGMKLHDPALAPRTCRMEREHRQGRRLTAWQREDHVRLARRVRAPVPDDAARARLLPTRAMRW